MYRTHTHRRKTVHFVPCEEKTYGPCTNYTVTWEQSSSTVVIHSFIIREGSLKIKWNLSLKLLTWFVSSFFCVFHARNVSRVRIIQMRQTHAQWVQRNKRHDYHVRQLTHFSLSPRSHDECCIHPSHLNLNLEQKKRSFYERCERNV